MKVIKSFIKELVKNLGENLGKVCEVFVLRFDSLEGSLFSLLSKDEIIENKIKTAVTFCQNLLVFTVVIGGMLNALLGLTTIESMLFLLVSICFGLVVNVILLIQGKISGDTLILKFGDCIKVINLTIRIGIFIKLIFCIEYFIVKIPIIGPLFIVSIMVIGLPIAMKEVFDVLKSFCKMSFQYVKLKLSL